MLLNNKKMLISQTGISQRGFSLVELLVGLVIGLLATLVIMQIFSTFEGQKRTTTGTADAQVNGSIALFSIQRDMQTAGFGLPVFDTQNPPLKCDPAVAGSDLTVNHDGVGGTPEIDMFPLSITDGGAASDSIAIRYSRDAAVAKSGIAVKIKDNLNATTTGIGVDNNLGCNQGDVVLISAGTTCAMTTVNDADFNAPDTKHITLTSAAGASIGASLTCMGKWNQYTYTVANNQLQRNDASSVTPTPIVSEIVDMQAQYGVSATANSNQITAWVDASAPWATPSVANRNRIKAVRIAVVARNGLLEKTNVDGSATCSSLTAAAPTGLCAWAGSAGSPAPNIDLTADANWQRYRYRVYETIIPLRNMIWSKNTL
jgi:type IV pilus assembly protein PilW